MANKPTVELTFSGDEKKLARAADKAADVVKRMGASVEKSSDGMARALSSDAAKAEKSLTSLGNEIRTLPDGRLSVVADIGKAESDIKSLKGQSDTIKLPVAADVGKAEKDIKGLKGEKVTVDIDGDPSKAKQAIQGLGDLGTELGDSLSGGMASGLKGGIASAVAAVGGAVVTGIVDKINESNAIERSLALKFKLDPKVNEQYTDLFDTNMFEDINHFLGMGMADQTMQALADMGIGAQELSSNMAQMARTFKDFSSMGAADQRALTVEMTRVAAAAGVDIVQALKGADVAARTWGMSGWDATRLVDRGFSDMGIRADDWAETLNEYPTYFKAMGLTADDMFNVVKQGMDAGAMNTDKVADSFKELGIRVIDQAEGTGEALKRLGMDAAKVPQVIAAGGPAAREAIDTIIDRLRNMQDPVERNRLGVLLLGTQWEDSMRNAITSTDIMVGSVYKYNRAVMEAAMAADKQGDPALRKMIGSMTNAQLAAEGASVRVNNLGQRVVTLPSGKEITITAKDMASNTITSIANRDYKAVIKLTGQFQGYYGLPNGVVLSGSSARGNATGGRIKGPGTHTSDSIPRMLSNDEFVTRASESTKPLNAKVLETMNAGGDWQSLVAPRITPAVPVPVSAGGGGAAVVQLVITGTGGLFESVQKAIRNGDIQIQGVNV
jgi:hypothetical protein